MSITLGGKRRLFEVEVGIDANTSVAKGGEWVLVPKVATARMLTALWNHKDADSPALLDEAYRAALAAAPPAKVVELPLPHFGDLTERQIGQNEMLAEIKRRAK
jgi:hypothetical protein